VGRCATHRYHLIKVDQQSSTDRIRKVGGPNLSIKMQLQNTQIKKMRIRNTKLANTAFEKAPKEHEPRLGSRDRRQTVTVLHRDYDCYVSLERDHDYVVSCPRFPSLVATGRTLAAAKAKVKEDIETWAGMSPTGTFANCRHADFVAAFVA
jgi:hypothetical protein